VLAWNSFAGFGDALETDDTAVGGVVLPGRDFVEGTLEDLTLQIVCRLKCFHNSHGSCGNAALSKIMGIDAAREKDVEREGK